MSTFLQWAQLSAANAQISQLHALNVKFHAQRNAQAQQAILADVLFHTERRARQLSAVADPIVAAIFAEEWLESVHHVSENLFYQVEHKRSWAGAAGRLRSLCAPLGDQRVRAMAHQVRLASGEIGAIYRDLGPAYANPDAAYAALSQQHDELAGRSQKTFLRATWTGGGCVCVVLAVMFGSMVLGWAVHAIAGSGYYIDSGCINGLSTIVGIGLLGFLVFTLHRWSELRSQETAAGSELRRLGEAIDRLRAFTADPGRGGVLQQFYREHPLYGQPLPNVDDLPQQGSHVVERQTVVVYCRYCRALTPVAGRQCHSCGATSFA